MLARNLSHDMIVVHHDSTLGFRLYFFHFHRPQLESTDDEDFDPNKPTSDGEDADGDDDDDANSIINDDDENEKGGNDDDDEAPRRSKHKHADLSTVH